MTSLVTLTVPALLAGTAAAVAVLVWGGSQAVAVGRLARFPRAGAGIDGDAGGADALHVDGTAARRHERQPAVGRGRRLVGATGLVGALLLAAGAGSPGLFLIAALAGVALWRWADRDERAARVERERLGRLVPEAADLLAACLDAGAHAPTALEVVGHALGPPLDARLRRVAGALRLGADPSDAWAAGPRDPLAPLARAFIRASRSGAPLAGTVGVVADEQRRRLRWSAEAAARRAGVAAVGPLAACFLPAFVLIGVVPVVLSVAAGLVAGLR